MNIHLAMYRDQCFAVCKEEPVCLVVQQHKLHFSFAASNLRTCFSLTVSALNIIIIQLQSCFTFSGALSSNRICFREFEKTYTWGFSKAARSIYDSVLKTHKWMFFFELCFTYSTR